jgi:transposase InsO family protein
MGRSSCRAAILRWLLSAGIETACIDPGKPWQNGLDESFNGKFRDECLTLEWFRTRPEAMAVIESWRQHYNDVRPHSSLSQLTPAEFKESMQRGTKTARRSPRERFSSNQWSEENRQVKVACDAPQLPRVLHNPP